MNYATVLTVTVLIVSVDKIKMKIYNLRRYKFRNHRDMVVKFVTVWTVYAELNKLILNVLILHRQNNRYKYQNSVLTANVESQLRLKLVNVITANVLIAIARVDAAKKCPKAKK